MSHSDNAQWCPSPAHYQGCFRLGHQDSCELVPAVPSPPPCQPCRDNSPPTTASWRNLTCPTNADGVGLCGIKRELLSQTNLMLPLLSQVILIQKTLFQSQVQISEADLGRIITKPDPARLSDAILPPMKREAMQMRVIPAHNHLENMVQISYRTVASD